MMYQKLSKSAKACMYVAEGIATIIGIGVILLILFKLLIPHEIIWGSYICYGLIIIMLINALAGPNIRYYRYQYLINEECIEVKEGYWFIERNIVPIQRLHKIKMERGPIDRLFGLTKVIVTTAGGDVTIRFLEEQKAEYIADQLKKKINAIAVAKSTPVEALVETPNGEVHKEEEYGTQ